MSYRKKIQLVKDLDKFSSLSELAVKSGYYINAKVLKFNIIEANRYFNKYLNVPIASKLFHSVGSTSFHAVNVHLSYFLS